MMICARTDVFALQGEEEALRRCRLFMEAGADMAKPQGIDTPDGIRNVLREVPGPFIATLSQAAGPAHMSPADLDALGVHAATLPSLPLFAAAKAVRDALRELQRTRSVASVVDRLLPLDDYYAVVRLDEGLAREKSYDDAAARLLRD
jgi:methylisocitrate lyase